MAPSAKSRTAPVAAGATTNNPTRYFFPILAALFLAAALLPTRGATPLIALVRHTTIMTVAAAGFSSSVLHIVLHNTGKVRELGHWCVPLGVVSGAIAAASILAQRLPLEG